MVELAVEDLELHDNKNLISPPMIDSPLYQCTKVLKIFGFIPRATLDVQVNGTLVINDEDGGFPLPNGKIFEMPFALMAGNVIRARQHFEGATSHWTENVTVRDHTIDYPTGPPRPQIHPEPVYKCGSRTGVKNLLLGSTVWITTNGSEVGRVDKAAKHQGVNVDPDYILPQEVRAWAKMCEDPSPPSQQLDIKIPPSPLPLPTIEPLFEGSGQITINDLVNGSRFHFIRDKVDQGLFRTWGGKTTINLITPAVEAEKIDVFSVMCPGEGPTITGSTKVQACSKLPAPGVAPIQEGDEIITLTTFVSDAQIKVFLNGEKVGDSGGPVVKLTKTVHRSDTIDVLQIVGKCVGQTVQELKVKCVDPPTTYDPSALDLYPVGNAEYDGGITNIAGYLYSVKGIVYYPAEEDGSSTPFNNRVEKHGPIPIVFMAHGNHKASDPSHLGYDYFQQQLAKMGIIAVSVFLNETNGDPMGRWPSGRAGGIANVVIRAYLILASISHFQKLNSFGDPIFGGKIDLSNVGLMGHSRAGEAVLVVPEILRDPSITTDASINIKCIISLAPVKFGATFGSWPSGFFRGYSFLTILPAMDGDVIDNSGAEFYDQTIPDPLKCQVYVNHANHNFFNRQWTDDDTIDGPLHHPLSGLPVMSRRDHEQVLSAYGCAFFRSELLGHNTSGFLLYKELPAGVITDNVHLSFNINDADTIDNYEDDNGIETNSIGELNSYTPSLIVNEYNFSQHERSITHFNNTFFGNTIGMVIQPSEALGIFRWAVRFPMRFVNREIWIRCADVYDGTKTPSTNTGFELGLERADGSTLWVDSDDVGGIPIPIDRRDFDLASDPKKDKTKTMLKTLRFSSHCLLGTNTEIPVTAITLRMNRPEPRALAVDDLQIVRIRP